MLTDVTKEFANNELQPQNFHRDLAELLNRHGLDSLLDTPDHVLATMVVKQLDAYGEANAATLRLAKGGPFEQRTRNSLEKAEERHNKLSYDLNQEPTTETVELGGCRGKITIPKKARHDVH